jgi:hypothetical protein
MNFHKLNLDRPNGGGGRDDGGIASRVAAKEAIDPKKGSVAEDSRRRAIGRGGEHSCFVGCWK